jgi:glucose-1-phosphate cytidylyltransferase
MKVIILAGGLGTRLSEETESKPKPMVLVHDRPILWHLMNSFAVQGLDEFVLALGYRGDVIKRWLLDINDLDGDITIDTSTKEVRHLDDNPRQKWHVSALETGLQTQTGGRIQKSMRAVGQERVLVTYGDGLANIQISKLIAFHEAHGKLATLSAVRPPARFGHLHLDEDRVSHFGEKNQSDEGWINGGFFILEPDVMRYVHDGSEPFETGALPRLVSENQLMAYKHEGFWQPMDTLREKNDLSEMAKMSPPPWLRMDSK